MPLKQPFDLVLFHTTLEFDQAAVAAGVSTLIVDWEQRGKEVRQRDFDTQINVHTASDLQQARSISKAHIICRLNGWGEWTTHEVETAIDCGADEVLLPMVRSVSEVNALFELLRGRCQGSIMLETCDGLSLAKDLAQLPLSRVYVGLNDLSIDRKDQHLFVPMADGTVEQLRLMFTALPFGFGGLTLPRQGFPLTSQLLINEMARLDCDFSFLRRSFVRDMRGQDLRAGVEEIQNALQVAQERTSTQIAADQAELLAALKHLPPSPWKIG